MTKVEVLRKKFEGQTKSVEATKTKSKEYAEAMPTCQSVDEEDEHQQRVSFAVNEMALNDEVGVLRKKLESFMEDIDKRLAKVLMIENLRMMIEVISQEISQQVMSQVAEVYSQSNGKLTSSVSDIIKEVRGDLLFRIEEIRDYSAFCPSICNAQKSFEET